MNIENLVMMANDIATFFEGEVGAAEAHKGTGQHMRRFWDPRMREAIIDYVQQRGDGELRPSAARAVRELAPPVT